MLDARQVAIDALAAAGIRAYAHVPVKRPDEFCTVEATGNESLHGGFVAVRTVGIDSWAGSALKAQRLAQRVDEAMRSIDHPDVTHVERETDYDFPDFDGSPRYYATYRMTVND
jgi:RecJ-like exonuclease